MQRHTALCARAVLLVITVALAPTYGRTISELNAFLVTKLDRNIQSNATRWNSTAGNATGFHITFNQSCGNTEPIDAGHGVAINNFLAGVGDASAFTHGDNTPLLPSNTDYTFTVWVKAVNTLGSAPAAMDATFIFVEHFYPPMQLALAWDSSQFVAVFELGSTVPIGNTTDWRFFVVSADFVSLELKLYVDAVLLGTANTSAINNTRSHYSLGVDLFDRIIMPVVNTYEVAAVTTYATALSASEVLMLYNAEAGITTTTVATTAAPTTTTTTATTTMTGTATTTAPATTTTGGGGDIVFGDSVTVLDGESCPIGLHGCTCTSKDAWRTDTELITLLVAGTLVTSTIATIAALRIIVDDPLYDQLHDSDALTASSSAPNAASPWRYTAGAVLLVGGYIVAAAGVIEYSPDNAPAQTLTGATYVGERFARLDHDNILRWVCYGFPAAALIGTLLRTACVGEPGGLRPIIGTTIVHVVVFSVLLVATEKTPYVAILELGVVVSCALIARLRVGRRMDAEHRFLVVLCAPILYYACVVAAVVLLLRTPCNAYNLSGRDLVVQT